MATPEQLQAAAAKIKEAVEELRRLKGWKGVWGAIKCAPRVVELVNEAGAEIGLQGADKKSLAVDILCALVPDAWVPDWVLRPILGWAIEKALSALKAKLKS